MDKRGPGCEQWGKTSYSGKYCQGKMNNSREICSPLTKRDITFNANVSIKNFRAMTFT